MKRFLVAVLMISAVLGVGYIEHNYTRPDCEVIWIRDNVVGFEDKCGFYWEWEMAENEEFAVGDRADLKMNDNFSSGYIGDDIITKIVRAE